MGDFLKNDILAIGSDHGGYDLKQEIIKYLEENGIKNYKVFIREFKKTFNKTPAQIRKEQI